MSACHDPQAVARPWRRIVIFYAWAMLMACFFANAEIQIEGGAGWATSLPTWRIEKHWLLDLFWGGRAMTGYHAWVFSFMILVFFMPLAFSARWRWSDVVLSVAGVAVFWVTEDFLWFVLNPAYGLARFTPEIVTWHPHWLGGAPVDYWGGTALAIALAWAHVRLVRREAGGRS
ncbi:hypothetical protein [Xenophilus sp. Marseille-Q4582]|uniref:hypothetical protein n=1 Tax=Xenophilus sp. Marseille-Q4582 TaxID=2866600 RepID=UPI001CE4A61E|nr:hypothetical protein [Xenophilus sp. Marseille-Q4582]